MKNIVKELQSFFTKHPLGKNTLLICCVILACTFLVKALTSGETLSEYAENNPEIAYQQESSEVETTTVVDDSEDDEPEVAESESSAPGESVESAEPTTDSDSKNTESTNTVSETGITLSDGFTAEALPADIVDYITGSSYPAEGSDLISLDDLRYLKVLYVNFDGETMEGEMICNQAIAQDLLEIFKELYDNAYPIERIELVDVYHADDEESMSHNNTSCFNYRMISGSKKLSKHSAGMAVDLNPLYNPAVSTKKDGTTLIEPANGAAYVDRSQNFEHKIDTSDLAYQVFTRHGFTWGGNWHSKKDYQHFEK